MKQRKITVQGFEVNMCDFGYAQYLYPAFNGNAEFKANKEGFKNLSRYLRNVNWIKKITG